MRVQLTQPAEGSAGTLPVGHVIDDPMAYIHVVNGIAEPLDDEARDAATQEVLKQKAARARRSRDRKREQREADQRRHKAAAERKERVKAQLLAEHQAGQELAAELGEAGEFELAGPLERGGDATYTPLPESAPELETAADQPKRRPKRRS